MGAKLAKRVLEEYPDHHIDVVIPIPGITPRRSLVARFFLHGMQHEVCGAVQYSWAVCLSGSVVVRYLVRFFVASEGRWWLRRELCFFAECMTRVDGARCRYVSWLTGSPV